MSRESFKNEKWEFVVGVDHVTSSFFQIWILDTEAPLIKADNLGVKSYGDGGNKTLPTLVERLESRFEISRKQGNPYPNLHAADIIPFAKAIGFNIDVDIYRILD